MSYQFNAFANSTVVAGDGTMITFAAGPEMPAGSEVRITGTGLTYDNVTGAMTGTITSIELYDPAFGDFGGARQTISIAAGDQAGLAGNISSFLASGLGMVANTFTAWNLVVNGFDHIGNVVFDPFGTFFTLELENAAGATLGYLRIEGTGLTDATLSTIGTISAIKLIDTDETTVLQTADYSSSPRQASAFEYGLLSLGIAEGDGLLGNEEVLYPVLVAGENVITKHDDGGGFNAIEGGAGADQFFSSNGGHVSYFSATSGVTINLGAGTASGGGGTDTWAAGSLGGASGSNFDDTITGGNFNANLLGQAGDDTLTGQGLHDILDGGAGGDTLNGGDGDDWLFGGEGTDTINGGTNAGDNIGDPGDGTDDVLFYSRLGSIPGGFGGGLEYGQSANEILTGITVTFTGTGAGGTTGGAGTDTFTGIEQVWGSSLGDTFNFGAGSNRATGFGGTDVFNGSTGIDYVDYDAEVFDNRNLPDALDGTFSTGVFVNMSTAAQTVAGITANAGKAYDSFGTVDTLNGDIEIVSGTQFSDALIGNALANELYGREGSDLLVGGAGDDRLSTGSPNEVEGGSLSDLVDYRRDGGAGAISVTVTANDDFTLVTDTHGDSDTIIGYVNVIGTNLGDTFTGNSFTNRFTPGRGDDTVTSGGGGDVAGGDQLTYLFEDAAMLGIDYDAERAAGEIKTNDATDTYWGTDDLIGFTSIWLEATQNDDILKGGAGNDVLLASRGSDEIDGRGGTDIISYVDFRTTLRGQGLTFTATTNTSGTVTDADAAVDNYQNIEVLSGSMFNDIFSGSTGADRFMGHAGNDTFTGNGGGDTVDYNFDADLAEMLDINLEPFADGSTLLAPLAPHGITANLDRVAGSVIGIFENLNTVTNEDTDVLAGIDNIVGSTLNDDIIGNENANFIDGAGGIDRLEGLGGDDTYVIHHQDAVIVEELNGGTDTTESNVTCALGANVEHLRLLGTANISGTGNTLNNIINGNGGANTLRAGTGIDTVNGHAGVDRLFGDAGNDSLDGGIGNDFLTGGAGKDTMKGGDGLDDFIFNSVAEIGRGGTRDKILDFAHLRDDIDLRAIDANGSAAGKTAFSFLVAKGAAFTGVKGQLHWFQINVANPAGDKTIIEGDINGDKIADFQIELTGLKTLSAADFFL